jgi:hypothetical protein
MMVPVLLASSIVSLLAAQQTPQVHPLPPSSLADFSAERPLPGRITRAPGTRCAPRQNPNEIVVCGANGSELRANGVDPELARRYESAPDLRSAGVQSPSSAMDASRCADGCPPQGQIDLLRGVRLLRRGLGRIFGGE